MKQSINPFSIPKRGVYNPNLTALRNLLALYVFFFHLIPRYAFYTEQASVLLDIQLLFMRIFQSSNETNPAVIAFLTLSGYCIHRNGFRINDVPVLTFLVRRCIRILPLLVVGTTLGLVTFYALQNFPKMCTMMNTTHISARDIFFKLLGIFAFIPYKFEELSHQGNGPLITCITELWLYAFYPLGMVMIVKWGNRAFLSLLAISCLLGSIICYKLPQLQSWWHNGSLLGFLPYWWIGAYAVNRDSAIFNYQHAILTGWLLLSALIIAQPHLSFLVEFKKLLFALLIACLLNKCDQAKPWRFLGLINVGSFSLYALHIPLICWALFFNLSIPVAIIAILIISRLSYKFIEKPLVDLSHRISVQPTSSGKVALSSL